MLNKKKLVIANYSEIFTDQSEINLVKLKHPKTNDLHSFLLVKDVEKKGTLFELVTYSQEIGSVFIDNHVQSDNVTYFATKFDIVYFLLSLSDSNDFISVEHLKEKLAKENSLKKDELKGLTVDSKMLEKIFDIEADSEAVKIKYNKSKCLKWLVNKVKTIEEYLRTNHKVIKVDAKVKSELNDDKFEMEAFELMSQYIAKPLSDSLRKDLNISSPLDSNENKIKRCKSELKQEVTVD